MASSEASQGRKRASTCTPRSREGTRRARGSHRCRRQLLVTGLIRDGQPGRAERRGSRRHQAAAETRRSVRDQPPEPNQLVADTVQARAHPGPGLHLELHQLLLHPRLPIQHPDQIPADRNSGAAGRSRSTNSSSTPSVIPPAVRAAPDRPPSTLLTRPAPSASGITAATLPPSAPPAPSPDHDSRADPHPEPNGLSATGRRPGSAQPAGSGPQRSWNSYPDLLRRTPPAAGPGPARGPLQRTATPPQPPAPPAPARPPRRRSLPGTDQAPGRPRRPPPRIRADRLEAQVKAGGQVLAPHRGRAGVAQLSLCP